MARRGIRWPRAPARRSGARRRERLKPAGQLPGHAEAGAGLRPVGPEDEPHVRRTSANAATSAASQSAAAGTASWVRKATWSPREPRHQQVAGAAVRELLGRDLDDLGAVGAGERHRLVRGSGVADQQLQIPGRDVLGADRGERPREARPRVERRDGHCHRLGTQPIFAVRNPACARLRRCARSTTLRCHAALGPGSGAGAARCAASGAPQEPRRAARHRHQRRIGLGAGGPSVAVARRARAVRVCPEPGGELHPPRHTAGAPQSLERRDRRRRCRRGEPRGVLAGLRSAGLEPCGLLRLSRRRAWPLTRRRSDGNGPSTATDNPPLFYLVRRRRLSASTTAAAPSAGCTRSGSSACCCSW